MSTAPTARIAAFQAGERDAFLISSRAGDVGRSLTVAEYVSQMDPWWDPVAGDQAADCAHRIGPKWPTTVYHLATKRTIEKQIVRLHGSQRERAARLLEGADPPASLSTEVWLELLRASRS